MNTRIALKFQALHMVTAFGWAAILFLGLITRGLIEDYVFYMIVVMITVLFLLDMVYLFVRVVKGHYLLITNDFVRLKRFFKDEEQVYIADLESVELSTVRFEDTRIKLFTKDQVIDIKENYTMGKDQILFNIESSSHYPKNIKIIDLRDKK
jgi:hypothetical protein